MKKQVYVVYDSGVGGLTVLAEIIKQKIKANFVYVGDTLNAPYGDKTPNQIISFVKQNLLLLQENYIIKGVVMACNTASILAKKALEDFFSFPVFSISESISQDVSQEENLCFFTTRATEKSGYFQTKFENAEVRACERFVPLIEGKGFLFEESRRETVKHCLEGVRQKNYSKIVLACTHFPFLKKEIEEYTQNQIEIYDPSQCFARKLTHLLEESFFDLEFVVTGSRNQFAEFVQDRLNWNINQTIAVPKQVEKEAI